MKKELIIEAGMNAIPYIGGSLATLYFGQKNEERFERLEKFYIEIKEVLAKKPENYIDISKQKLPELENIISDIHDKVENETRELKRKYLKNFFIKTLETPIVNDFDERKIFLDSLDSMSELDCNILAFISKQNRPIQIKSLTGGDIYMLFASVNKLISNGFLETRRGSFMMNGAQDEKLDDLVFVSSYGHKFVNYVGIN